MHENSIRRRFIARPSHDNAKNDWMAMSFLRRTENRRNERFKLHKGRILSNNLCFVFVFYDNVSSVYIF